MMDDTTDEEIFQAVMDAKEDNGGHGDIDGDAADIPGPTRNEALQAALMLQRYVQDLDDPFARKLEGILSSFGRQTRLSEFKTLVPTEITDYFPRNN